MKGSFFKLKSSILLILILGIWSGCKVHDNDFGPEPVKNIEGVWKIDKVVRNGTDITSWVDVSDFQLTFQRDSTVESGDSGSYKLIEGAPFVVDHDGTWALNDPAYPFNLLLFPSSGDEVKIDFSLPDINGENQIKLVFSPGCPSNSYQYFLKKIK